MPIKKRIKKQYDPKPKFALSGEDLIPVLIPLDNSSFVPGSFLDLDKMSGVLPNQPGKIQLLILKYWKLIQKYRIKILKYGGIVAGIVLFFWMILYWLPVGMLIFQTQNLSKSSYSDNDKKAWAFLVNNFRYFSQPAVAPKTDDEMFGNAVLTYMNGYKEFNKKNWVQLIPMTVMNSKESQINLEPAPIETDNVLLIGFSYNTPAQHVSFEKYMECKLDFSGKVSPDLKFLIAKVAFQSELIKVKGQVESAKAINAMNDAYARFLDVLKTKDIALINTYLSGSDSGQAQALLDDQAIDKLAKYAITIQIDNDIPKNVADKLIYIAKFNIVNDATKNTGTVIVYYNYELKQYTYEGLVTLSKSIKSKAAPTPTVKIISETTNTPATNTIALTCSDCSLAPVDKTYTLSSSYAPTVTATGLNGGGQVNSVTKGALQKLFSEASAQGINIKIISSYRSFSTQKTTFNYWVDQNMKGSASRAEAEIKANRVSAKPGHSEHQLGTTVDLKCNTCGDFDNSANNLTMYKFLENNAYKFGFAISYANGTEQYTGYKYEPWHIRFIGIDLATEFYNTGYLNQNGMYLAKFLKAKGSF